MTSMRAEIRRLAAPLAVALALLGAGAVLVWSAGSALATAQRV